MIMQRDNDKNQLERSDLLDKMWTSAYLQIHFPSTPWGKSKDWIGLDCSGRFQCVCPYKDVEGFLFILFLFEKQRVGGWRHPVWSDEDRPGRQGPPDQRRHGPGAGPDVQRQAHTDTAGHCLSQFTHTDRGERHTPLLLLLVLSFSICAWSENILFSCADGPQTIFFLHSLWQL